MLCVSGLMDLDLIYADHKNFPFGPAATFAGVGVKPGFGPSYGSFFGSINNANLLFDLKFVDMVRIHGNIDYVNAGVKEVTYEYHPGTDWNTVYQSAASLKVDELYAVLSTLKTMPLYAKIGRFYLDFGNYLPNGYGLPTITPSLTQLMTQVRTGGAQIGIGLQNGVYGSATWSTSEESLLSINRGTMNRNYSARLGMMRQYQDAYFNVNASYIWDVRDADFIAGTLFVVNSYFAGTIADTSYSTLSVRRQHAYAVHADGKYGQWGGGIEGAAVTGPLGITPSNSNLWTAGANINYSFPTLGHDSSLDLSYQIARHAAIFQGTVTAFFPPFTGVVLGPLSNQFPKNRVQATYTAKIVKHVNIAFQWVRDRDFAPPSGTNQTSNFGIFRIDFEV
jgi:hypothetical protein